MISYSWHFQAMMDLPIDKERAMRQFDNEKKWDIVCDQVVSYGQLQVFE